MNFDVKPNDSKDLVELDIIIIDIWKAIHHSILVFFLCVSFKVNDDLIFCVNKLMRARLWFETMYLMSLHLNLLLTSVVGCLLSIKIDMNKSE